MFSELLARVAALEKEVLRLRSENARLRSMLFGPGPEKMPTIRSEVRRRLEEEDLAAEDPPVEERMETVEEKIARATERRRKLGRKKSEAERE